MSSGLAKTFFSDTYQHSPWQEIKAIAPRSESLFQKFLTDQRISYLDYILTLRLLRDVPDSIYSDIALCICHLILAAKEGHLCIRIDKEAIFPSPSHLWARENSLPLQEKEIRELEQRIYLGFEKIPSNLFTYVTKEEAYLFPMTPLCRYKNLLYLQRHWIFETMILQHLNKHMNQPISFQLNNKKIEEEIQSLLEKGLLLDKQAEAIQQAIDSPFSLIAGGPGTGKTYTAGHLIKLFWNQLSSEQKNTCEIVLAAPTGKAAANLQRSLNRATADLTDFPPLTARTLHSLLGLKGTRAHIEDKTSQLSADLILVDEGSMVDVRLMALLLGAIKEGSRLIILGDKHQLPSVEAGNLFSDLMHLTIEDKKWISCTTLQVCLRAELKSIIEFASAVNQGNTSDVLSMLNNPNFTGLYHTELAANKKEALKVLFKFVQPLFPSIIHSEDSPKKIVEMFNGVRLLSPLRKGPWGVDDLNQFLWNHFIQHAPKKGWIAIPIIVVANDYRQDLFNGETGVLIRKLPLSSSDPLQIEDYALFESRADDKETRNIPALLLPKYEYAYCLSVHKSQGSEFDHVILMMPEGSEIFGREVFYTAITRTRKQLNIFGSQFVLAKTIVQQGNRLSGLAQRAMDQ